MPTAAPGADGGRGGGPPPGIDTSRPHPARMYDYYLGGYDNYEVDREAAEQVLAKAPEIRPTALANRAFLHRTVRYLAGEGVRQFIDIGTGVPTAPHIHDVAGPAADGVRVAYVDNDPIVRVHALARLTRGGANCFVQADLRDPAAILADPGLRALIDFGRPVAVLLTAVLHFVRDEEDPAGIVAVLRDALCPGSHIVVSHITADFNPEREGLDTAANVYDRSTATLNLRDRDGVLALFAGLDLVEPGLVQVTRWRPDEPVRPEQGAADPDIAGYGGVGRKP